MVLTAALSVSVAPLPLVLLGLAEQASHARPMAAAYRYLVVSALVTDFTMVVVNCLDSTELDC